MKVLELKGYKSLRALNAFHTLMLGVKMLPAYASMTYEDFAKLVSELDETGQEKILREAALFVELQPEEVEALICFCTDPNGVPYGPNNMKNLGPKELVDIIVAVCLEIGKLKVGILTETEKKN